jgi:hypothetical protein
MFWIHPFFFQVRQLLKKYDDIKEQIEHIRIKIELISYFTPIGALGMFCEDASLIFFKPKYYMEALRAYFSVSCCVVMFQ